VREIPHRVSPEMLHDLGAPVRRLAVRKREVAQYMLGVRRQQIEQIDRCVHEAKSMSRGSAMWPASRLDVKFKACMKMDSLEGRSMRPDPLPGATRGH